MSHLPVLLLLCLFIGTQLRDPRKTITQFVQSQLNTKGFPGRDFCSPGLHTRSSHFGRALEIWSVEQSAHSMPLSGFGQPGCPAHNIPSPQRGQGWQLPSGKSGPQTCVHTMPGSYARQMEAEDQQMSELEGTRTLTVPVRQHLVPALSFGRWQKPVPREVYGLAQGYRESSQQSQGQKIHFSWFWTKLASFFLGNVISPSNLELFPSFRCLMGVPAHAQTTRRVVFFAWSWPLPAMGLKSHNKAINCFSSSRPSSHSRSPVSQQIWQ